MDFFDRTNLLIGEDNLNKLNASKVIVFGVGGVGGYTAEMLVRAGIGKITIVDFDVVDKSNINRQVIALHSTVGRPKVEVMQERLKDINPSLNITAINDKVSVDNVKDFHLGKYDYVIDAIDIVSDKISLIKECKIMGVRCISAMGAGNRYSVPQFEYTDIFKTHNDGLAKIMRKRLKEEGINSHEVVFTSQNSTNNGRVVGSISYYPAMCGCYIAGVVVNNLISQIK